MALLPPTIKFPEPGPKSFVRYYDRDAQVYKFLQLVTYDFPFKYPFRLPSLAAGSKSSDVTQFKEINPSRDKHHRYMAYLGVCPGFNFYLWHPADVKMLKWDESIVVGYEDDMDCITYEESPIDSPTKFIWIEHDRWPAIGVKNIGWKTATPAVLWVAARYLVKEDEQIDPSIKDKLASGELASTGISFGGEF